jgi:ferredoxin
MTHVVTNNCKGCKFTECVLVCPVDCFFSIGDQLVIDPEECIDCSACVAECPVEAIYAEDELPEADELALDFNATASAKRKNAGEEQIVDMEDPLPSAEQRRRELGF